MRSHVYCKKCYADLSTAAEGKCPKCGRGFKPNDPRTYLRRPFPGTGRIVLDVVLTTAFAVGAAFAVALHQAARSSGH
jgi:hypothetical protein